MTTLKEEYKINRGIFICPNCNNQLDYRFKNSTIWDEAQKELLEELSNVIIVNEDKLLRQIINKKLKELSDKENEK